MNKKLEKDFKCEYCEEEFDFSDDLQTHLKDTGHEVLIEGI
jgi:hypothetical protein